MPPPAMARLETLRALRGRLARQQGVPAYVIFHDTTLRAIAMERPRDMEALAQIAGIGARKLERYGALVLAALAEAPPQSSPTMTDSAEATLTR